MRNTDTPDWENKSQSWRIFSRIFRRYDFLNTILSFGLDAFWRRQLLKNLQKNCSVITSCLDVATGTGAVALILKKQIIPIPEKVIGIDLCEEMLQVAIQKVDKQQEDISFLRGDACDIPFSNQEFDCVTMAFGIRNVPDVQKSLQEIHRVLNFNGVVGILEFSLPKNFFIKKIALLYLRYFVPTIGWIFSGDKKAYVYLNKTIETFPYGNNFANIMRSCEFVDVIHKPLCFGMVTLYIGKKVE